MSDTDVAYLPSSRERPALLRGILFIMCGIVGYIGNRPANALLHAGLECMEYRGYDSVGIAVQRSGKIEIIKAVGRVQNLKPDTLHGTIGIGHTRWATHGIPSEQNAHPHPDCTGKIVVVHNGIIENYLALRQQLSATGHVFKSETDTEVIAHLIESHYDPKFPTVQRLLHALQRTLRDLDGVWGIAVLHADHEEIVVSRNGVPLMLGIGKGENFVASDPSPILEHTKRVIYLDDLESAQLTKDAVTIFDCQGKPKQKPIVQLDWSIEQAQKGGFQHFMLKEIYDQPMVVKQSLKIPITVNLHAERIFLVACGTAWHAALVGKYLIEQLTRIPVTVDVASEFRYRDPLIGKGDLFIAISQSGETADTLAALRLAKQKGARTLGIINVLSSTIAREADEVIYTRAGMEVGVASTKAFLSQLIVLYLIAEKLSDKPIAGLRDVPKLIEQLLKENAVKEIAEANHQAYNFLFIGRNLHFPIALEGALKLKEISYVHAEGYAAGEMKHGPIALVTHDTPTVAIAVRDAVFPKMLSNIQEVRARNGKVIAIGTAGDAELEQNVEVFIPIPEVNPILYPLLTVIPLQLLAYYIADARECDIDKPRNLAKSVTVE